MSPSISVIMPAYNAERTIELALRSIRMQTIADQIEILVIDGGSTDATREIARQYGAVILENPHRLPEPAKLIGIQRAKGRYIIEQDTDEELLFPDQLEKRLSLLRAYPEVHLVVVDEQAPGRLGGVATRYVCVCGDPFTQFIYTRKNGVLDTFRRNIAEQQGDFCLLKFAPGDLTPIGDGGASLFDLEWIKQQFPQDWNSISFVCSHRIGIPFLLCVPWHSRFRPNPAAAAVSVVITFTTTPAPHSVDIWPNCGSGSSTTCFTRRKAASVRGHPSSRAPATPPANTCLYCTPPRWSALW